MTTNIAANLWIKYLNPNPQARLRLFCFPYAGAGASIFNAWPNNLPLEVEVCPIQLPGRESRLKEPPFTQISLLIQTLIQVLRPHLNIPFAFFGHSMGSLLSFELTRQLRRQNAPSPVHLFVASRRAPQVLSSTPSMYLLPEPEFIEKVRLVNGTSEAILQNPKWMQLLFPILRADLELCETYRYTCEAPLICPISAFGGYQDDIVSEDEIAAWSVQTDSSFMLRMFSGNHFFLNKKRDLLLQAISKQILDLL